MKLPADVLERLAFLDRVVQKEVLHLDYADSQVFFKPLDQSLAEQVTKQTRNESQS